MPKGGAVVENATASEANEQITCAQFETALGDAIRPNEKRMLLAHYHSLEHSATRTLLALVGYCTEDWVNSACGNLAKRIALRFGYERPGDDYTWTSFLAKCTGWKEDQAYIWRLHPALVQAIQNLGWHRLPAEDF